MERCVGYFSKDEEIVCFPCNSKKPKILTSLYSAWMVVLFFIVLLFCALLFSNSSMVSNITTTLTNFASTTQEPTTIPFTCNPANLTCPSTNITSHTLPPSSSCPEYFRWIHEDLRPWAETGITEEAVLRAKKEAAFRLIISNGRAYIDLYHHVFQTRDIFTIWGILQLLQRYPGRVPDLDLMFNCEDMPVVRAADYKAVNAPIPPPLFRYCKDDRTVDIVFPDWSFWGWVEVNIKPWEVLMKEIKQENERLKWVDRVPYAYWRGNPDVAGTRHNLLSCNVSKDHEWNARVYRQDWFKESRQGFKESNLASQCTHRYKIYIEGRSWSVSEKYILACDSPTLFVSTRYHDFFTRGLIPGKHFWPIPSNDKCRSIKFAVDWGNSHQKEAQELGKTSSGFMQEQLSMDYVYDFMLHLLTEYSKLLKYKPVVPPTAVEYCMESMACTRQGLEKQFMLDSMVKSPSDRGPCAMPPPYDPGQLQDFLTMKANATKKIEELQKNSLQH
ncbi:LOW QUALITY PROTEIN: O-glucosyltransferase rumi homolog [Dioscorea cayenensis subsp. rotundata]|uniref:LOW QUALITY PROTEIN: O-glucosyltransferase rumi homolog n=1 Tax=Dioscorea cayennensis subsp. rotundata TaxID=55577 RepID=A0AB40C3W6_DIOCR|nr:LOW QUALITY PROTEIN: O-glucosyltransferase rumi homolog [Dioscorea cayenensis subsp. rotundata]